MERKKKLLDDVAAGKPAMHQTDPILMAEAKWKEMFPGKPTSEAPSEAPRTDLRPAPNAARPLPTGVGTGMGGGGAGGFGGP